jgi:hypothetical protein
MSRVKVTVLKVGKLLPRQPAHALHMQILWVADVMNGAVSWFGRFWRPWRDVAPSVSE